MTEGKDSQVVMNVVHAAVAQHGKKHADLIPIMNEVNQKLGYLPSEAMEEISRLLETPKSNLFSVATFYHMLSTQPRGRHVIQFCESTPCHVVGGREVWEALQTELKLGPNETSEDGKWSLITTSCLGVCGIGPVMVVDDDIYGNVTPSQIPEILARYE